MGTLPPVEPHYYEINSITITITINIVIIMNNNNNNIIINIVQCMNVFVIAITL